MFLYFKQIELFTGLYVYSFNKGKMLIGEIKACDLDKFNEKYVICTFRDSSFISEYGPEEIILN